MVAVFREPGGAGAERVQAMTAALAPSRRVAAPGALGGALAVWRGELLKLVAHVWTRGAIALCVVGPFLAVAVLQAQSSVPEDTLFGRWVHSSGFALPLVILAFSGQWVLPVLAAVVAGDIFSSEDQHGMWKAVLTRSCSRSQIFAGKVLAALTWSVMVVVVLAAASITAGLLIGHQPLIDLSGRLQPAGHSIALVIASWATALPPTLGFTALALFLSVLTQRSIIGIGGPVVLGLAMQLASLANGPDLLRVLLVTTGLDAWHGLWVEPVFTGPLVQGVVVSAVWCVLAAAAAYLVFLRRDVSPS